jgi:hypothetical protein
MSENAALGQKMPFMDGHWLKVAKQPVTGPDLGSTEGFIQPSVFGLKP